MAAYYAIIWRLTLLMHILNLNIECVPDETLNTKSKNKAMLKARTRNGITSEEFFLDCVITD